MFENIFNVGRSETMKSLVGNGNYLSMKKNLLVELTFIHV